jgi:hypothetical protein
MKTKFFFSVIGLLVAISVVTFLSGCDKDLGGINNSPNAVSEANVKTIIGQQAVLVGLQSAIGDWYSGDRSRFMSIWTRQMCAPTGLGRPQPAAWNNYLLDRSKNSPNDYNWSQGYRAVKLANDIIYNATDAGLAGNTLNTFLGIAKFYKALVLGDQAVTYGDVPIETRVDFPVYAKQSAVLAYTQTLLDEAIGHFQAGTSTLAMDLPFKGDAPKWIAACNSLKARHYLFALNYANAASSAAQGISATTGTVNAIYSLTAGEYSPWGHWTNTETGEPIRSNKYYVDMLKSEAGDKRLTSFLSVRGGMTTIIGFDIYGDLNGSTDEKTPTKAAGLAKYGPYNAPFPLMSYEENLLIRAEAKARTGDTPGAITDLNTIRTTAGLTAKVAGDFANTAALITEILKQKYLQLFLEGQAYHDMRRVNKTDGTPLYRAGIPTRWLYVEAEITTNVNCPKGDSEQSRNELW